MKVFKLIVVGIVIMTLQSCSIRLVDFTVISSKNVSLNIDKTQGKQVEGKASYFLNIGFNIKDALDNALQSAGPGYDLLVDGVVRYSSYPFVSVVKVEGVAISSSKMRAMLSEEEYKNWLGSQNIFDPETAVIAKN